MHRIYAIHAQGVVVMDLSIRTETGQLGFRERPSPLDWSALGIRGREIPSLVEGCVLSLKGDFPVTLNCLSSCRPSGSSDTCEE